MRRKTRAINLLQIGSDLDQNSHAPLYEQVEERIAAMIMSRAIDVGAKLPSSRELAQTIGVSRNTVVKAYDSLITRGLLRPDKGSGSYAALPDIPSDPPPQVRKISEEVLPLPSESEDRYSELTDSLHLSLPARPFRINFPALDAFPLKNWASNTSRLLRRLAVDPKLRLLGEGSPSGETSLRKAVTDHLRLARGVDCDERNVLIFSGADQALDVVLKVIVGRNDAIWCEDPSYRGMTTALSAHSDKVWPVAVDENGFNIELALETCPDARAAYVFASNHFPLNVTMSAERRRKMLDWAEAHRSWIIECDYDSELRYSGRPLPTLYSLDNIGSVIYIGTLSKITFPSLRIGYAVIPDGILNACIGARSVAGRFPILDQLLAADFMESGALARHLRRMRNLYAKRQVALIRALERHAGDLVTIRQTDVGMQLIAWLPEGLSDVSISAECAKIGIEALPMTAFSVKTARPPALVLGFAAFNEAQLEDATTELANIIRRKTGSSPNNTPFPSLQ